MTERVAHIGKSEICTKFRQLEAKISPWKWKDENRINLNALAPN